jgi:nitroreductase/dihydropteridine reductase
MSFIDIAKSRYTTKKYDPTRKIDADTIEELKEILRFSPSSINSQPWKFTFISNEEIKKELAKVSYHNESKVNDTSHVVVFSVVKEVKDFEEKNLPLLPERATLYYNRVLKPKSVSEIKTWLSCQVYVALGFFLSACACMGIDTTAMEGIQLDEYDRILQDDGYRTLFAVCIGFRDKDDENQPTLNPKFRLDAEKVIRTI